LDVVIAHVEAGRPQMVQGCLHVSGVPEHDDVDDEAQGAELVLLASWWFSRRDLL
jgi:hypothetical protein